MVYKIQKSLQRLGLMLGFRVQYNRKNKQTTQEKRRLEKMEMDFKKTNVEYPISDLLEKVISINHPGEINVDRVKRDEQKGKLTNILHLAVMKGYGGEIVKGDDKTRLIAFVKSYKTGNLELIALLKELGIFPEEKKGG